MIAKSIGMSSCSPSSCTAQHHRCHNVHVPLHVHTYPKAYDVLDSHLWVIYDLKDGHNHVSCSTVYMHLSTCQAALLLDCAVRCPIRTLKEQGCHVLSNSPLLQSIACMMHCSGFVTHWDPCCSVHPCTSSPAFCDCFCCHRHHCFSCRGK